MIRILVLAFGQRSDQEPQIQTKPMDFHLKSKVFWIRTFRERVVLPPVRNAALEKRGATIVARGVVTAQRTKLAASIWKMWRPPRTYLELVFAMQKLSNGHL